ncbi:MAG TPA: hypothetical protein DEQ34_12345 [Balneolaceae bacterium]|nr:hypothetical protein [Balneolaceae bacterium]|tara:strand:- start:8336 stop:8962 length:627 start_codon:yes stop_codon:yes gene_type:complete
MKKEQDYLNDLTEIRSMMERSSKFLSLSGWAGVLAGIYAIAGAWVARSILHFDPDSILYYYQESSAPFEGLSGLVFLGLGVLMLSLGTAVILSVGNARKKGEKAWNTTSKRMMSDVAIILITGGMLSFIFIFKSMLGLLLPTTLIFYGLAIYMAGNYTFKDVKVLGLIEITLGLLSILFIQYSLALWTVGFGALHIVYGSFIYAKYER